MAALTVAVWVAPPASVAHADVDPAPPAVLITQDRDSVSVSIGDRFSFSSTVRAPADASLDGLVAHLNILSLDPDTYVDPEDWSDARTQYLLEIPAGGQATLAWTVQAVNHGRFVVYVALARAQAGQPVLAGPGLRADVTAQRVINAEGDVDEVTQRLAQALAAPASLRAPRRTRAATTVKAAASKRAPASASRGRSGRTAPRKSTSLRSARRKSAAKTARVARGKSRRPSRSGRGRLKGKRR